MIVKGVGFGAKNLYDPSKGTRDAGIKNMPNGVPGIPPICPGTFETLALEALELDRAEEFPADDAG